MAHHEEPGTVTPVKPGDAVPVEKRDDDEQKAATLAEAGSSARERLAGSAVGFGGAGPNGAGVYTSAARDGMAVDELLNDGQEEVFSRTEVESGRIEHHRGEEPAAAPIPRE